ncbi:MAG: fibronectin type III domain-containing protein, partial [Bacteroidales bacterium]|nr:fibronectin type III domain-containing protein [Bacteroidales bacterium]
VGAFGYINSFLSPIDPNKFGHPTPDLGPELTLCGTGSATITATVDLSNLEQGEQVTYKWYKGSTLLSQHNGKTSITVTEAGTYTCELVETTGSDWTTSGKVVVSATLPDVAIGDDAELCKVTSATFSTDVAGDGINYTWYKDNKVISGATTNSYTAYSAGTYKLTISASGCASKSDEAVVTSQLPVVVGDTICTAGRATLSVTTSGEYSWYSVAEEGNALASGSTYSPNITKTTTYYVQDASSLNTTAGPSQSNLTNSRTYGTASVYFKLSSAVQITQMSVVYGSIYYGSQQALSVTVGGKTYTSAKQNVQNAGKYTFSFESNPIILSAGSYTMELKPDNAGFTYYTNLNYSGFQHSDIILFNNNNNNDYGFPGTYDWKIVAGSTCARTPVFAVLDPDNPNCAGDTEAPSVPGTITVSNITTNSASVSWGASTDNTAVTGYDVYVNGTKLQSVTTNSINLSDLNDNTEYIIKVRAYDEAGNLSDFNTEKSFTTLKSTVTQSISLSAGWNLISFYVLPEDASITNVFGSNISKVSIVKNNDGFYKPGKADKLQSLTEFEYGQAYLVKANSAFSISVEGVAPTSTTISLKAGWNLLGYPKATEANASTILSGIAGKYTELKDLSASQTTLKPGKGYYIKMNTDATVTIGN